WFIMAFAGLHTLEEMRQDYWHPLFGSVTAIEVSFLSHGAAWRLVTQPTPDFDIDYDSKAVEWIIQLTHGQPYLIQLICHTLVTRFNRQTFEEGVERKRRFTIEDVQAVINAPEFYRDGNAYFQGIWVQAETSQPPGQTDILKIMAHNPYCMPFDEVENIDSIQHFDAIGQGLSLTDIAKEASLSLDQTRAALDTLQRHDVIIQENGKYRYAVELMRRWVKKEKGAIE
ncbi:MAG: hypothetical protein L0Y56_16125, partial [Nitrospira sp.]|nr:hypothetical protein [Nitrospira sp.]